MCSRWFGLGCVALGVWLCAGASWAGGNEPKPAPAASDPRLRLRLSGDPNLRRLSANDWLDRNVKRIELDNMPFREFASWLNARTDRINVVVMWPSLAQVGVPPETKLTGRYKNITLRTLLRNVLADLGGGKIAYDTNENILTIAPAAHFRARPAIRVYDLADLIANVPRFSYWSPPSQPRNVLRYSPSDAGPLDAVHNDVVNWPPGAGWKGDVIGPKGFAFKAYRLAQRIRLIATHIAPETWDGNGGPGTMVSWRNMIVVRNFPDVHQQIREFLGSELDHGPDAFAPQVLPAPEQANSVVQRADRWLELYLSEFVVAHGTFAQSLRLLESADGAGRVHIVVAPEIRKRLQTLPAADVSLTLRDVTVRDALRALLDYVGGLEVALTYAADGETMTIATRDVFRARRTVQTYEIADVMVQVPDSMKGNLNQFQLPGSVRGCGGGACVGGQWATPTQSTYFMRTLDSSSAAWQTQASRTASGVEGTSGTARPDGGRIRLSTSTGFRKIDNIRRFGELLLLSVWPESWKDTGGDGTITYYDNRFIIHTSPDVHQTIRDLLGPEPDPR